MATPIWKDTVTEITASASGTDYTIVSDSHGNTIFAGKAYAMGNDDKVKIYLNRICKDALSSKIVLDRSTTVYQQPLYKREFNLSTGGTSRLIKFYNDWSYQDIVESPYSQSISMPLSDIVDPRQLLMTTVAKISSGSARVVRVEFYDGRAWHDTVSTIPSPCVTLAIPVSELRDGKIIYVVNDADEAVRRYRIEKTCAQYCLYYLNAHGGFDHLLINGNALRTDAYTHSEVTRDIDNTTLRHSRDYASTTIKRKWQLHTDTLTDAQWALTHHLLGSTQVYLHDLEADEITPVVITSSQAEFKTYRNQGNKKSHLTIEVEASVERMRK
jgi:hypothetical protein